MSEIKEQLVKVFIAAANFEILLTKLNLRIMMYKYLDKDLLAVGLIVPLIPPHVKSLGASYITVGLMGSIYAAFQLGSGPLIGSWSDLKGRKNVLVITLLLCSITYTALGFATSILTILVLRAILGLCKQTQILARALVPDYEKNERIQSSVYGKIAAISGFGITIGPVIGGHVVEAYADNGFAIIAMATGCCFLINAGLVYLLPKGKRKPINYADTYEEDTFCWALDLIQYFWHSLKMSAKQLIKIQWSKFGDIFVYKLIVGFAMGVYYSNYSAYLKNHYELSPKYIGYVISFQGIVGSISSYFIDYINRSYKDDLDYTTRNFHVFLAMNISLLGLISAFNIYIYMFWLIPLAICNAVARLVTLEMLLNRSHGKYRATLIGASNSVRSFSGVIAPMVSGIIGQFIGVTYVIYASLIATVIGTFLSYGIKINKEQFKLKAD